MSFENEDFTELKIHVIANINCTGMVCWTMVEASARLDFECLYSCLSTCAKCANVCVCTHTHTHTHTHLYLYVDVKWLHFCLCHFIFVCLEWCRSEFKLIKVTC
jgi:hypothetical protein